MDKYDQPADRLKEIWSGGKEFFEIYTNNEEDINHIRYILDQRLEVIKALAKCRQWTPDYPDDFTDDDIQTFEGTLNG